MRDCGPLLGREHNLRSTLTHEDVSPNVSKVDSVLGFGSHSENYEAAHLGSVNTRKGKL